MVSEERTATRRLGSKYGWSSTSALVVASSNLVDALGIPPVTLILFCVNVPALSAQTVVARPIVSQEHNRRTRLLSLSILVITKASADVMVSDRPSGISMTTIVTESMNSSRNSCPLAAGSPSMSLRRARYRANMIAKEVTPAVRLETCRQAVKAPEGKEEVGPCCIGLARPAYELNNFRYYGRWYLVLERAGSDSRRYFSQRREAELSQVLACGYDSGL
ncbi:hypothetical protein GGS23DRAFT_388155 [Durotheca rogersii]|uniref:uncharacterized protein n=1 Tax=Durotheca rogersii TaxID=419775 RepID=UPI0022204C5A|nr:uncharacterized protein GGS23DRAFT_388155 [Durotheca rogersii]KAI5857338.1 hypothetical protein GGS23DRAFT_388155 [Durotheca rogersii]